MSENKGFSVSKGYRRYVLFMLMIVYTFNFIDRQILVILQEHIKADLDLSDTQLGLMTGFAFAVFYVVMGLPIARLADRSNRRNIITIALTVWSGMTAISGFAQNYWHLLLARIGVGIGEAGGSPPAHAMISDYYPPEERATALSIYSTGIYVGIMVGFLAGGYIADTFGWRYAFFIVGLPGILLAVIVRLTVKEPPRGLNDTEAPDPVPIGEVAKHFTSHKTMVLVALGCATAAFIGYGNGNFMPAYLARLHGMTTTDIGILLSISIGVGGMIGTFASGYIADWLGKKDIRWYAWLPASAGIVAVPLGLSVLISPSIEFITVALFLANVFNTIYLGPSIAVCHSLSKPAMRALVSAILFFVLNLIGLGLGPLFVGILSDYFTALHGNEGIRYALLINISIVGPISIGLFYFAGKELVKDMAKRDSALKAS